MSITPPPFLDREFAQYVSTEIERAKQALIYELMALGEETVNIVKTDRRYKDQTGNLTSSVGYAIVVDGALVSSGGFRQEKSTATQGVPVGTSYVQSLAAQYPTGITLIVVAGMNYAAYVETKGYGGMTNGEQWAKAAAADLLKNITGK